MLVTWFRNFESKVKLVNSYPLDSRCSKVLIMRRQELVLGVVRYGEETVGQQTTDVVLHRTGYMRKY